MSMDSGRNWPNMLNESSSEIPKAKYSSIAAGCSYWGFFIVLGHTLNDMYIGHRKYQDSHLPGISDGIFEGLILSSAAKISIPDELSIMRFKAGLRRRISTATGA